MVAVPRDTPHTLPVVMPTVATAGLLLVHKPPPVALVQGVQAPTHTLGEPVMALGNGLTVTVAVLKQPLPIS